MVKNEVPEDIRLMAGEARSLMSNPLLVGAFEKVEAAAIYAIKNLEFGPEESEVKRDKLMITLQVTEQVKEMLYEHIENLQMAENSAAQNDMEEK
ncbi:MAG: hypothetical protein KAR40_07950 [Candidatus Sabulitectum sp.]|nr:hypothetical protein [Candidatus Sabulitectum sp.]